MNFIGDLHVDKFAKDCYKYVEELLPINQVQDSVEQTNTLCLDIDEDIQISTEAPRNFQQENMGMQRDFLFVVTQLFSEPLVQEVNVRQKNEEEKKYEVSYSKMFNFPPTYEIQAATIMMKSTITESVKKISITTTIIDNDQHAYDEYLDDEEHIFTSTHMEIFSIYSMYDNYEFEFMESSEEDDAKLISVVVAEN